MTSTFCSIPSPERPVTLPITILRAPPFDPPNAGLPPDFDLLATRIGAALETDVPQLEAELAEAPGTGLVLHWPGGDAATQLDVLPHEIWQALVPRLVLLRIDRGRIDALVAHHPVAAVVDAGALEMWQRTPELRSGWSGLVVPATALPDVRAVFSFAGGRYVMRDGSGATLAELIAQLAEARPS